MALKAEMENAPPQRRTQQERRAETRAKLINATINLLNERGAVNTTTEEIAKEAGLTRGALQYHFESPNALLKETVTEIARRMSTHLEVEKLGHLKLPERIDFVVDEFWKEFSSSTYTAFIELAVRGRHDPDLARVIKNALDELEIQRESLWLDIFSDCNRDKADLLRWRGTLLVALRGLAYTKLLARPGTTVDPQVDQFKEMFKLYLLAD